MPSDSATCEPSSSTMPHELDVLAGDAGLARARRRPAQQRLDARLQLAHAERLGEVVVAADLQSDDLVELGVAGRQEQHRNARLRAQAAADLVAVDAGQHDVEHHQIEGLGLGKRERLVAVDGDSDARSPPCAGCS